MSATTQKRKSQKISDLDWGLHALSAIALPGVCYSSTEQALLCGVSRQRIEAIEKEAKRKLKERLLANPIVRELLQDIPFDL